MAELAISNFCNEEELRKAIDEYIDYYNNYRYQERYGTLAPIEVRNDNPIQYPIPENKRIHAYKAMLESKKQSA